MITFYDRQISLDAGNATNSVATFDKKKGNASRPEEGECINGQRSRPFRSDINQRIQRVQESYFLERRIFL